MPVRVKVLFHVNCMSATNELRIAHNIQKIYMQKLLFIVKA